jgi:hypothetical protein
MTELLNANAINSRKRASYTNEWKNAQGMSRTVIDYVLLSGRLWQAVVERDAHGNDPEILHVADKLMSGCNGHRMLFTTLEFVVADNSVPRGGQRDRGGRPPDWKTHAISCYTNSRTRVSTLHSTIYPASSTF